MRAQTCIPKEMIKIKLKNELRGDFVNDFVCIKKRNDQVLYILSFKIIIDR